MNYSNCDSKGVPLQDKLNGIFNKKGGFFIELGANDGLFQSNTAFFEKNMEWSGILIEPSLKGYEECKKNRPKSVCLNCACVSNDYKNDYIEGDFKDNSPMGSICGNRLRRQNLVKVKAVTLEKILDEYCHTNIDLLSLDTEGYELEILKGLNLNKYRPKFMLIEIYNKDYNEIINFLNVLNYKLHSNFTNYNKMDNPTWDGTHNDYLFVDNTSL
jgi:FkbM family methyltransferase